MDKYFISFYKEIEGPNYPDLERKTPVQEDEPVTQKMTSRKTIATTTKAQELELIVTRLVKRLENIKKEKVLETSWARLQEEIKKWAYKKTKMTEEGLKVNHSTIMNYMNAPLMESFGWKK